jgi:hypothetical protein
MSLFEDSNPRAPKEMPAGVHLHTMVLRDCQRDFVWEPGAPSRTAACLQQP